MNTHWSVEKTRIKKQLNWAIRKHNINYEIRKINQRIEDLLDWQLQVQKYKEMENQETLEILEQRIQEREAKTKETKAKKAKVQQRPLTGPGLRKLQKLDQPWPVHNIEELYAEENKRAKEFCLYRLEIINKKLEQYGFNPVPPSYDSELAFELDPFLQTEWNMLKHHKLLITQIEDLESKIDFLRDKLSHVKAPSVSKKVKSQLHKKLKQRAKVLRQFKQFNKEVNDEIKRKYL